MVRNHGGLPLLRAAPLQGRWSSMRWPSAPAGTTPPARAPKHRGAASVAAASCARHAHPFFGSTGLGRPPTRPGGSPRPVPLSLTRLRHSCSDAWASAVKPPPPLANQAGGAETPPSRRPVPKSRDGSTNSDWWGGARGAHGRALDGSARAAPRTVCRVGRGCAPARMARCYLVGDKSCERHAFPNHRPTTIAVLVQRGPPRDHVTAHAVAAKAHSRAVGTTLGQLANSGEFWRPLPRPVDTRSWPTRDGSCSTTGDRRLNGGPAAALVGQRQSGASGPREGLRVTPTNGQGAGHSLAREPTRATQADKR